MSQFEKNIDAQLAALSHAPTDLTDPIGPGSRAWLLGDIIVDALRDLRVELTARNSAVPEAFIEGLVQESERPDSDQAA